MQSYNGGTEAAFLAHFNITFQDVEKMFEDQRMECSSHLT
jgi:hypothetical protein